jgi:hypothetical protein
LEVFEALRLADLKCRTRGGRLILVGDIDAWGEFDFPVLESADGALLAIGLRETIHGRKRDSLTLKLPEFLMRAGAAFFLKGSRAAIADIEKRSEWLNVLVYGLRQMNALPSEIRPARQDARSIMNALTELTLTHPKFAVQFVREFRELYERIRPSIFMDIARAATYPN